MEAIIALAYGIITFAVIIGVGVVVVTKLGDAGISCGSVAGSDYTYYTNISKCSNGSTISDIDPPSAQNPSWVVNDYMRTQLGSTGLAGWTPAIIAITIGMFFLGMFLLRGGQQRTY